MAVEDKGLTVSLNGEAQNDIAAIVAMFGGGISDQAAVRRSLHLTRELLEHGRQDGGDILLRGGKVKGTERLRFL